MRTSTAIANGYRCPKCGDEVTRDEAGLGYVRHMRNQSCDCGKGERDEFISPASWHAVDNRDNGSLRTGTARPHIGDVIEIRGEGKLRHVTYVMGSEGKWHATFKGQGAVPEGQIEWRLVKKAVVEPPLPSPLLLPPLSPVAPLREARLQTLKLILEIVVLVATIVGGIVAIAWRSK